MNTFCKMLMMSGVLGLLGSTTAIAITPAGTNKALGIYTQTWWPQGDAGSHQHYRSASPMVMRSDEASNAVAQTPSDRRTYSYEPSQQGSDTACTNNSTKADASISAEAPTSQRSFSYEPAQSSPVWMGSQRATRSGLSIDAGRRAKGY